MHGHHEDSTKVDLLLTAPSQVIEAGPGEGEHQRLAPLRKLRRGQVCFELSWVLIAGAHVSAKRASRKQTHPGLEQAHRSSAAVHTRCAGPGYRHSVSATTQAMGTWASHRRVSMLDMLQKPALSSLHHG
jgi:hypothetical protein